MNKIVALPTQFSLHVILLFNLKAKFKIWPITPMFAVPSYFLRLLLLLNCGRRLCFAHGRRTAQRIPREAPQKRVSLLYVNGDGFGSMNSALTEDWVAPDDSVKSQLRLFPTTMS